MILLAINCGFGNRDCAALPISLVESGSAWLDYPRPKTGVERRLYLWPETRSALQHVLELRKEPKAAEHQHLLFVTKYGTPWFSETKTDCPISKEFRKLLDARKIYRRRLSFYALHC